RGARPLWRVPRHTRGARPLPLAPLVAGGAPARPGSATAGRLARPRRHVRVAARREPRGGGGPGRPRRRAQRLHRGERRSQLAELEGRPARRAAHGAPLMSFATTPGSAAGEGLGMNVLPRAAVAALVLTLAACAAQEPPVDPGHTPKPRDPSPPPPAVTARWSDPSAWPSGRTPQAGEAVRVPAGTVMLLDVTTPPLASLT